LGCGPGKIPAIDFRGKERCNVAHRKRFTLNNGGSLYVAEMAYPRRPDPQEASLIADEASNFLCGSLKIASAIAALLKEPENPNDGSIIFAR
jgi:hypothetical protein